MIEYDSFMFVYKFSFLFRAVTLILALLLSLAMLIPARDGTMRHGGRGGGEGASTLVKGKVKS